MNAVTAIKSGIVGAASALAIGAALVLPGRLHPAPEPDPIVSTVVGQSVGEPFPGWDPQIEAWAKQYGWGSMHDLSARWEPLEQNETQITSEK